MNTVAKFYFDVDSPANMYLVHDEFWELAQQKEWTVFGSIKSEFIEDAKKLAKEVAEKNETSGFYRVYGANDKGRFDSDNLILEEPI